MPLSPDQIKSLRKLFDEPQKATATYPGVPPKPTSSSIIVSLAPGSTPPVIRLRSGYVTSLVFLDSSGQPWPIVAYDLGNPDSFNLQPTTPDGKSNTVLIQAKSTYQRGNLAVYVKRSKYTSDVDFNAWTKKQLIYRGDLRIPGFGPNAKALGDNSPLSSDPVLVNFLDGVPPQGAKTMQVVGGQGQAWVYGKHLYLRTGMTLLSPSWTSSVSKS